MELLFITYLYNTVRTLPFTNNMIIWYNFYGITSNFDINFPTCIYYVTEYSLLKLNLYKVKIC